MQTTIKYLLLLIILIASFASSANTESKQKPTIIALAPHIVEMLYDIGAGEQIIGTTTFADYPEQAKNIPVIGNYVRLQIEKVIALQPDYIIAWKSGSPSDDLARLQQLGFNIVYSQPNSFEDIAAEMRTFGELTGHTQEAQAQAQQFLTELAQITKKYQDKTPISAFYELGSRPLITVAKGSWPQQFLDICRVSNPFEHVASPYPQVNIEKILQTSIQVIIQPVSLHQSNKQGFNWQDWPVIPAVQKKQIIQPNADAMHRMTMRSVKELKHLCADIDKTRALIKTL